MDKTSQKIKELIVKGKEKGFLTYEELNNILVPRKYSSERNFSNNLSTRARFACFFLGFRVRNIVM